jgi:hypothetical protein
MLTPAASANSRCVHPAARRRSRSNWANDAPIAWLKASITLTFRWLARQLRPPGSMPQFAESLA